MTPRRAGLALLAALAALLAANAAWIVRHPEAVRPLARGQSAPPLALPSLAGGEVDLAALRGQVVLVDFWASWCQPCVASLPHLDRIAERYRGRGLRVLAVNVGEDRSEVARFARRAGLRATVLLDESGRAGERWGVRSLPFGVVVGRDGRVRAAAIGPRDERQIAAMVEPLL